MEILACSNCGLILLDHLVGEEQKYDQIYHRNRITLHGGIIGYLYAQNIRITDTQEVQGDVFCRHCHTFLSSATFIDNLIILEGEQTICRKLVSMPKNNTQIHEETREVDNPSKEIKQYLFGENNIGRVGNQMTFSTQKIERTDPEMEIIFLTKQFEGFLRRERIEQLQFENQLINLEELSGYCISMGEKVVTKSFLYERSRQILQAEIPQ